MRWNYERFYKARFVASGLYLVFGLVLASGWSKPVCAADFEPLDEIALMSMIEHLKVMQQLAPQLRIQLRSVRMNMKFDVREIHNIERSIGKAQTDIERLIAMHETNRVNAIRAHFLVDDLRRKASALDQGLSHVTQRIMKKYGVSEENELQNIEINEEDSQLLSLLQDYSQLMDQSLQLVSGASREESPQATE
ncbi:MAG: hypothetical protein AB2552_02650 [Candidatus Thiodiazotropha endolucinida]